MKTPFPVRFNLGTSSFKIANFLSNFPTFYCRVEEWPVTLDIPLAVSAVSSSCPFGLTIALLHSLPHETVDEACLP